MITNTTMPSLYYTLALSELSGVDSKLNKKLDYCRRAAQRAVSVRISSIAAQQIKNKSK